MVLQLLAASVCGNGQYSGVRALLAVLHGRIHARTAIIARHSLKNKCTCTYAYAIATYAPVPYPLHYRHVRPPPHAGTISWSPHAGTISWSPHAGTILWSPHAGTILWSHRSRPASPIISIGENCRFRQTATYILPNRRTYWQSCHHPPRPANLT